MRKLILFFVLLLSMAISQSNIITMNKKLGNVDSSLDFYLLHEFLANPNIHRLKILLLDDRIEYQEKILNKLHELKRLRTWHIANCYPKLLILFA